MAISLHCESCSKKIKAPNGSGGQYGKCPYCKHRNYIPMPKMSPDDEIRLAPIDESEETKYAQLMQETFKLTEQILDEKAPLDEPPAGGGARIGAETNERDLLKNIIVYLIQMSQGQLDAASRTAKQITPYKVQTTQLLERIKKSSQPEPELAEIPPQVLKGLIENLKNQL